jgi:hypothetical protein
MLLRTLTLLALTPTTLFAQRLARQIDDVSDGTVRFTFAARPGVCGDGREMVRTGPSTVMLPSSIGDGRHEGGDFCYAGPASVAIARRSGETVSIRVQVGGRWSSSDDVTDLGTVSASEAARYLFAEALRANGNNSRYALAAAVFADSVDLTPDLVRLAKSRTDRNDLRQRAVFWIGTYDDPSAGAALHEIASDDQLDEEVRGAAIIALGRDDISDADVAWLRKLYPHVSSKLRDNIFLAVSRSASPQASRWLASVITDPNESEHNRQQAMFWMGQGHGPTDDLIRLYDRLSEPSLRTHYAFVLSQRLDEQALEKLMDMARYDKDRDVRHQALFWLGQSKDPRALAFIRDLVTR